jgi:hypothetical protein
MIPAFQHFRFSLGKALAVVAVFALIFVVFLRPPPSSWVGEARLRIRLQLVESVTGEGLPDAVVVMSHPRRGTFNSSSDADGMAEFVIPFELGGTNFTTHTITYIIYQQWNVKVTLADGLTVSRDLSSQTGDFVKVAGSGLPERTIRFELDLLEARRKRGENMKAAATGSAPASVR